jgi:hypothetical protein
VATPIWLTPRLCVGDPPPGISGLVPVTDAEQAAAVVETGATALLPPGSLEHAKQAMLLMGASEQQIERAVTFGTTGSLPEDTGGWE